MEIKYKNRTYVVETYKNIFGTIDFTVRWLGYSATNASKEKALEACHQMIEEDFAE